MAAGRLIGDGLFPSARGRPAARVTQTWGEHEDGEGAHARTHGTRRRKLMTRSAPLLCLGALLSRVRFHGRRWVRRGDRTRTARASLSHRRRRT